VSAVELLRGVRVVPVVVIDDADKAVPLAHALLDAGLRAIEVTLRTPAGLEAIRRIAAEVPDMIVGAGSVRQAAQVSDIISAGARFGVCPGSSPALLDAVDDAGLPFIPGAITPSETLALLERGYSLQKLFPAELSGGVQYLKGIAAPIPEAHFMPTGGITVENAPAYLALDTVDCIGGTWIAPANALAASDFDTIANLARAAAAL
jgi:2-dehydro-3-deoxyphosphogluconate aldolase/(4S)-4-hydroxy-2-oxoglutarate aldolase